MHDNVFTANQLVSEVSAYPAQLSAVVERHNAVVESVEKFGEKNPGLALTPQREQEMLAQAGELSKTELAQLQKNLEDKLAQAEQHLDQFINPRRSEQAELAHQVASQRNWERLARQLDSGKVSETTLIAQANLGELRTLQEELPGYLRSKGQERSAGDLGELIEARIGELLPADQKVAWQTKQALKEGRYNLNMAVKMAEYHLSNDTSPGLIPAFRNADGSVTLPPAKRLSRVTAQRGQPNRAGQVDPRDPRYGRAG